MQNIRKISFGFWYSPEDELEEGQLLSRDEIADRLGEEMVQELADSMLCP